jgi:mannose-6-phosphate isomerase class I
MKGKQEEKRQAPLPLRKPVKTEGYDIYPSFVIAEDQVHEGYESLADLLLKNTSIIIDGYAGVHWGQLKEEISRRAEQSGISVGWVHSEEFLRDEEDIERMTAPYAGGDDPLFGTRCSLLLSDFFMMPELQAARPDTDHDINIIIGPGATLAGWNGLIVYADLPKNELQYRSRSAKITNLGIRHTTDAKVMYKRSYFIDWPVLNRHKEAIFKDIDLFIDTQRPDEPVWIEGNVLREALKEMGRNFFRVRPWFEPGPWGGTWIMDHIRGLSRDVLNYAWSYELITPENGLLLESSSLLLEVSFDSLMFIAAGDVLGDCYDRFGTEFPIRFDFLDTFNGENLSIQCHPRPDYIKENFGENFTQEECYYILNTKDNAFVYLGFHDDIDPAVYREKLEESATSQTPFDADSFIMKHPAAKHDLFLIPYGTAHGSGTNNLVLEISTTPYIFTFKMYDWLRMDLNGRQRDLNIKRAINNLFFDRKGKYVTEKLKSIPVLINEGTNWQLWHLPTHETHLYDVHRYNFRSSVEIATGNKCLVMNLVEGKSIMVETRHRRKAIISYAETFVIPAAAESIKITNVTGKEAMLVVAFVK